MSSIFSLKHISLFVVFAFISLTACNKEDINGKKVKSLHENIFVKNSKNQLFSYDIDLKKIDGKIISFVKKNEVITLGKSPFVDKTKPFYYNFKDTENFVNYINEGKVWFVSNNDEKSPIKITIPKSIELRKKRTSAYVTCECELAGTGSGNNDCEYEDNEIGPMCWSNGCITCDFIVCPDIASRCLHETQGGGIFVIADSLVLGNSNVKYVLGQNTILKFEIFENETICYREQFENKIYRNGIYDLNVCNFSSILDFDKLWFIPFDENIQSRNGTSANPTCRSTSCNGSCDLTTGSDGCQRCSCSTDGATTNCKMELSTGINNGGVLLLADDVTIIDL